MRQVVCSDTPLTMVSGPNGLDCRVGPNHLRFPIVSRNNPFVLDARRLLSRPAYLTPCLPACLHACLPRYLGRYSVVNPRKQEFHSS